MDLVRPCIKCGSSDRYNDGHCRPCRKRQNANRNWKTDKHRAQSAAWKIRHPEYAIVYRAAHKREKAAQMRKLLQSSVQFRLAKNLRTRTRAAVKNNQKSGSAVKDLGCSITELKQHLEKQFQPGMTWNNWSHNGWHIDHIVPLAEFDLANRDQFLKACHYSNLQPLWAKDNLVKKDRHGN